MGPLPIVTWLALQAATPARPALSQVLALPLADRASLVIEFSDAVPHASLTAAPDNTSATIETGPLVSVAAQDLEAGPELKCIASVAVRGYRLSAGTLMRVLVRFRSPCQQKMRVTGRRIYLDVMPLQPSALPAAAMSNSQPAPRQPMPPAPAGAQSTPPRTMPQQSVTQQPVTQQPAKQQLATEPPTNRDSAARKPASQQTAPQQSSPRPQDSASRSAAPPRAASTTAPPAAGEDPTERAYRALEADALKRAKTLSAQGNVKGMQALRDEAIRRDAQLGRKRPDIMTNLFNDLDRYTDEARAVRLKLDALLFRKSQPG